MPACKIHYWKGGLDMPIKWEMLSTLLHSLLWWIYNFTEVSPHTGFFQCKLGLTQRQQQSKRRSQTKKNLKVNVNVHKSITTRVRKDMTIGRECASSRLSTFIWPEILKHEKDVRSSRFQNIDANDYSKTMFYGVHRMVTFEGQMYNAEKHRK